jgi:hypothetical protein
MSNLQHNKRILREGLRPMDLEGMVYDMFEIDTYKSKMGDDRDVCVLSFRVKDRMPAIDMMEFVEKGFNFVLDADVSAGENEDGEYHVFVELPRKPKLAEYIKEITSGVRRLTGIKEWFFRYHKEFNRHPLDEETVSKVVPNSPMEYDGLMEKQKTESIKQFFNKTLMDNLSRENDIITIHKPFKQQIKLRLLSDTVTESLSESPLMDSDSMAEVFWLTKVLGDYNITKYGDKFAFENQGQTYFIQRIE